jgi:hypothetical protein
MFLVLVLVGVGFPTYLKLHKEPTCTDGTQNQNETDTDKGGVCPILDERYLLPQSVVWARTFQVRAGEASAIAYIENPNPSAGIESADYIFKVYDDQNIEIASRSGNVKVTAGAITPIYEGQIDTGSRSAARAFFEWSGPLVWTRIPQEVGLVQIENKVLEGVDTQPILHAKAVNVSARNLDNIAVIAVVYDQKLNAFAASRTIVDSLAPRASKEITFTWPNPLGRTVTRIDVLPITNH